MATSLADQLNRLAVPSTDLYLQSKKKSTLLFDPKEAASINGYVIFEIGLEGLDELIAKNEQFEQFKQTLFNNSSKDFDRNVQTKAENNKVDKIIEKFLILLSPYILMNCSHKALEWLYFRYNITEFNKTKLILMALPYYSSNIFTRIVQSCRFEKGANNNNKSDPFQFLKIVKQSNTRLQRLTLYDHILKDGKLMNLLIKFLSELIDYHQPSLLVVHFNFFCQSICGAIEVTETINESFISNILPLILRGINSTIKDFASCVYIILSRLLLKTSLNDKLLNTFIEKLSEVNDDSEVKLEVVLLLVLIYQLQTNYKIMPKIAFDRFIQCKWIFECLEHLHSTGNCIYQLLEILFKKAVEKAIYNNDEHCTKFIMDIVKKFDFDKSFIHTIISILLNILDENKEPDNEFIEDILIGLKRKSSDLVESVIIENNVKYSKKYDYFFQNVDQKMEDEINKHSIIISADSVRKIKEKPAAFRDICKIGNNQLLKKELSKKLHMKEIMECINLMMTNVKENNLNWNSIDYNNWEFSDYIRGICIMSFYNKNFKKLLNLFLNKLTQEVKEKIVILLNICAAGLVDNEIINKLLDFAGKEMENVQKKSDSEDFVSIYLITLLSTNKSITSKIFNLMENWLNSGTAGNSRFIGLMEKILTYKEEILIDSEQIMLICENFNLHENKNKRCAGLKDFIQIIQSNHTPIYVKQGLLKIISKVTTFEFLEKLCEYFVKYFNNKKTTTFNKYELDIICNIINRFDLPIIPQLTINSFSWKFIQLVLKQQKIEDFNEERIFLPCLFLRQLSKDMYYVIPDSILKQLLDTICEISVSSENQEFLALANKIFKHIDLDASLVSHFLNEMNDIQTIIIKPEFNKGKRNRKNRQSFLTIDTLESLKWRKGVCLLEFMQVKKKIRNSQCLLSILFDILKRCLDFEDQTVVEYLKQLILSLILLICNKLEDQQQIKEKDFNIELVVQCIRASQNPQTHYHALLALAYISKIVPNQVLQHVMAIFTFMGSTLIRHDDAYSFEIITKIVDTIIPILVTQDDKLVTITDILRVFVDALLDVPEHRRIPLYTLLINHINAKENLYLFLVFVCETEVFQVANKKRKIEKVNKHSERIKIALDLCGEFSIEIILQTSINLIKYINELPNEKDATINNNNRLNSIVSIKNYTDKQFRHFKYLILTFLSNLLSLKSIVTKVALLSDKTDADDDDDERNINIESLYKEIIINSLTYIQKIQKLCDSGKEPHIYWKSILYHSYDLLDNVNNLLTPKMFLLVIKGLLVHSMTNVKKRALELLNNKLQNNAVTVFQDIELVKELFVLVKPIFLIIEIVESNHQQLTSEQEILIQTALLSLKLIVKTIGNQEPDKFIPILESISSILNLENIQDNLLASVILCITELCVILKGHALQCLILFMPGFLNIVKKLKFQDNSSMLLLCVVTAINKLLESFGTFLNPYLVKILRESSILISKWSSIEATSNNDSLSVKLMNIKKKVAQTIPARILIPTIEECFDNLSKKRYNNALVALLSILEEQLNNLQSSDVNSQITELTNFFLKALEYRCNNSDEVSLDVINLVETQTVKTITVFTLKLSESTFRPFYLKLFDWAVRSKNPQRLISFYHLSESFGKILKGLFALFASTILNNLSEILRTINNNNTLNKENRILLLEYVLKTLQVLFIYDNKKIIHNRERFELLMQPLIDLLETNLDGIDNNNLLKRNELLITPTIVHFACAIADDGLWKEMNYQILLKMRNSLPEIRLVALHCLTELVTKLKDDFMPLLPETIPFLSELLEDENELVERTCQKAIREMEKILGEPLQKYF